MKKTVFILSFLCLLPGLITAQTPTFKTEASSTKVSKGEPFRITFTVENASDISGFKAPDFNGFEVLQNSQSQSISVINGKTSRKLSYVFILRPQAIGNFTIAGASVRINGDETRSNPINITVVKGQNNNNNNAPSARPARPTQPQHFPSSPRMNRLHNNPAVLKEGEDPTEKIKKNVFVKVDVDKKDVYVGQQITADYKLYTRLPTSSKVVKVPSFSGFSTHDLKVPNPVRPKLTTVDGKDYRMFTFRKTILFPLQAGTQKLEPVQIENDVRLYTLQKSSGGGDPFSNFPDNPFADDPFFKDMFDDPFFQNSFGGGVHLVPHEHKYDMSSPVVKIHVKPLPEEGKPENFDNAVGHFKINAKVDKNELTTDDAVTFTVTISGEGNINLISAPSIQFPDGLESFDPKVKDDFHNSNPFGGSRTFTYVLMPNTAGTITIPAVSFSYFDPDKEKYETLHTQAKEINVAPGKNQPQEATEEGKEPAENALLPIQSGRLTWNKINLLWFGSWWHWLLMLLPVVILIVLLLWKRKRDALFANQELLKNKKANRVALKKLSLARKYLKKDKSKPFYEEVSRAIWGYLCDKLNIPMAELSRQKAEEKLKEKAIGEEVLKQLFTLLDRCEMALYAGESGHEELKNTYLEAAEIISKLENKLKKQRL